MLKVVLDTNQFISSLISKKGLASQILQAWREHRYLLISSNEILKEVQEVLLYNRISQKYHLEKEDIESLIQLLEHEAIVLTDPVPVEVIQEDPDDNKILACALQANADYIVSGDHHLLNLRKYRGIVIVTAREFLAILVRQG